MKYLSLIIILSFFVTSCVCKKSTSYKDGIERRTDRFKISRIDSTENSYIYQGLMNKKDSVILVVYKKSRQLKCKEIEVGKTYKLKTYDFYDQVYSTGSPMGYSTDGKLIWTENSVKYLRLTE